MTALQKPKVVVIGAGSIFFGRQILKQMAQSPHLREGTLGYVDIDDKMLDRAMALGRKVIEHTGSPLTLVGSTDRREVLEGADFVVLTFAIDGVRYRGIDTEIALKHGIITCSSDTIGPGGVFRALRSIPEILRVCEDVRRLCPRAWIVNLINPTAVVGIVLVRYAPDLRSFALCDGNHEPENTWRYLRAVGLLGEDEEAGPDMMAATDIRIAGVNHCTWLLSFIFEGRDMMPAYRDFLVCEAEVEKTKGGGNPHSKPIWRRNVALALFDLYGVCPTTPGHTKEYVPFWQGHGAPELQRSHLPVLIPFNTEGRREEHARVYRAMDEAIAGDRDLDAYLAKTTHDHAGDIIESMAGGLGKQFYINGPNQGAVANLPDDAFLELRREIDMDGSRTLPVGEMPRGVLGLTQQVLDAHELTAQAAVTCDRRLLRRAMMTDPIINDLAEGDACMLELLEAEKEALPAEWFAEA